MTSTLRRVTCLAGLSLAMSMAHAAPVSLFSTGFETDTVGWTASGGSTVTSVSSGTNGIVSAEGARHAAVSSGSGAFTRFGEYRTLFPDGGYSVRTKIYLNLSGGWTNDVRFDWTVASNQATNSHRRDFAFNVGFYDASDAVGPGAGSNRFIISASPNAGRANAYPKNPANTPVAVTTSGWYTFEHVFQNNGSGILQVVLNLRDSSDGIVGTWTISDPSDVIGSTVGGNRYGWLTNNEFSVLALDASALVQATDTSVPPVANITRSWRHATIQAAVDNAASGDVIQADAGTYVENVVINKALEVRGPNHNISPNGGVRLPEALISPATTNTSSGAVVAITASNVSFRGFTIDGDNASLPASGYGLGGAFGTSIDSARGIFISADGVTGITTEKNIIANVANGIRLEQATNYFASGSPAQFSTGIVVNDNLVINTVSTGIRLGNSMYAKVTGNTITNADNGIGFSSFRTRDTGNAANRVIEGNTISARFAGIWVNIFHASPYALKSNTINVAPPAPTGPARTAWFGVIYSTVSAPQNFTNQPNLPLVSTPEFWRSENNIINGTALEPGPTSYGYWLYHVDNNRDGGGTDHFGQITGGTITNISVGVMLKNRDIDPATNFGTAAVGAHAHLSGVTMNLNANGTGIRLIDDASWTSSNPAPLINKRDVKLTVGSGVVIIGGVTGLRIEQPSGVTYPQITGGALSDLAFSTQSADYITLIGTTHNLDATSATFDSANGATASQSTLFDIEDKLTHKVDDNALGLVRVKASQVYVSATSNLNRGISAASPGDTVNVEEGALVLTTEITQNVTFAGTFEITSSNFPSDSTATAVLTSFLSRKGASTVTANLAGMNASQYAAINANIAHFSGFTNGPVTIVRGMSTVGYAPTIQAGVDYASSGDVVRVSPGTYTENVTVSKNLTLESTGGRAVTTITGISNVGVLGTILVTNNTSAFTLGGDDKGFKVIGIDNGNPGMENAALYFQGNHTGAQVLENELVANGDAGLISEFGAVVSGWLIDGNIFSGQTFVGPNPADNGFGNQFTTPNVPRQLIVMGNGGGTLGSANATNITFTNNIINGVAGGLNVSSQEQGNHLITLDIANSTITGNSFQGTTTRFASSMRVRRPGTTISGNNFVSAGLGASTSHLFVQNNTTALQDIVAVNTFDKGAFVNGSTTVSVTIQNMVSSASTGATVRVLPANYIENITINKNLTLESTGGRSVTTITGISNVGVLGTILVTNNTSAFTLGGDDKGFKVIGIDNGNPGMENAALYFQGDHTGAQVLENELVANGDAGLISEYGTVVSGWLIDGNIFSGQTFVGPNPADYGFGNQFTTPNVPRQLIVMGNGGGTLGSANATNITFTNNIINGVAGGLNPSSQEQGNHLITLDIASSTITGNSFQGTTTRFASSMRVRRPGTTISGNTFASTGLGINTSHLFVQNNTTALQDIVAVNTFDKGAFVNGSTTVSVTIQNMVGSAASGSTVRVLPGTYNESVSTSGNSVTLSPALATSIVVLNGNLTLDANDGLAFDINGLIAGGDHDQWTITGMVTLGGATLSVIGSHVPAPNQSFILISNDLTDPVSGGFAGLPEGGLVTLNGQALSISYLGGSDFNDVVLNYIPEIVIEQPNGTNRSDGNVISIVDFPLTNVAATSTLAFTVRNTGTGPLSLGSITFDTAQFLDFSVDTAPPSVLAPGASASFAISFTPQASGERNSWMRIANGDADENPFDIRLRGNATAVIVTEWDGTDPVIDTPGVFEASGLTFDIELGFVPTPDVPVSLIHADSGIVGTFDELPDGGVVAMAVNGVIYYFQVDYTATDIFLTNFIPSAPPAWKWVSGPKARNGAGIYGTLGSAAAANSPGGRQGAMNWRAPDGNLWMFGGYGYARTVTNPPRYLNDLWEYRRDVGQWVWRSGSNTPNNFGVYGTQGVEAPSNAPGSRHSGTTWTDETGNLWLFGGYGVGTGMGAAPLNDLWRYNRATGQWTWMKGSTVTGAAPTYGTQGTPAAGNTPGARSNATGFYSDGALWLFGGYNGPSRYNDLWRYDISSGEWTWMEGSSTPNQNGVYGTQGTPSATNTPGSRSDATGWVAQDGSLWLFGGLGLPASGTTAGDLSDLWRYDPTSSEWTWIKGVNTTNAAGVYGTLDTPAPGNMPGARSAGSGWATVDGDFWLVGGFKNSTQSFDDVWIYDIASNQWTWKLGSAGLINQAGMYGTQGSAHPANKPGARFTPSTWVTLNGTLWIFGGGGADGFGNTGRLSDLWSYGIPNPSGTTYDESIPGEFPSEMIVNENPNTSDATAGTMAYVPVSGRLTGTDPDGDRLLFNSAGATTLSQGTLTLNKDGTWTYTPAHGFTGVASFQFKAADNYGGESTVRNLVISVITNPADSDGDGIADAYEQSIWGSLVAADGDGDADFDGQSNYFEFLAGTNPLSGGATLSTTPTINGAATSNGGIQLLLNHVRPGVNYHLEISGNMTTWQRVGTFTFDVSGSATVEDPSPATGAPKFYRMSLEATPAVIVP